MHGDFVSEWLLREQLVRPAERWGGRRLRNRQQGVRGMRSRADLHRRSLQRLSRQLPQRLLLRRHLLPPGPAQLRHRGPRLRFLRPDDLGQLQRTGVLRLWSRPGMRSRSAVPKWRLHVRRRVLPERLLPE
jgi:hypothetical protein